MTKAESFRNFFHQLFGSRLVQHLETELLKQQSDYESRLLERDQLIGDLRSELQRLRSKFEEMELDPSYFWYLANRSQLKREPPKYSDPVTDTAASEWHRIQAEHYRREAEEEAAEANKNGVSNSGRQTEEQQVSSEQI